MADELNTPTHRWYQRRYNIALSPNEVSPKWILAAGIAKIDAWIASISGASAYAVNGFDPALVFDFVGNYFRKGSEDSTLAAATTYTGASNGTMTDSDGLIKWKPHNLLKYSEDFSNAAWVKNNTTVTTDATTAPDGTTTADMLTDNATLSEHRVYNTALLPAGKFFGRGVFAKAGTASFVSLGTGTVTTDYVVVDLSDGSIAASNNASSSVTSVGDGWYFISTPSLSVGAQYLVVNMGTTATQATPQQTYSGSGDTVYIWGAHMYRSDLGGMVNNPATGNSYVPTTSAAVYLPRTGNHVYNGTAWVNEGLLLESEARTNLVTYSEDFTGTRWSKTGLTAAAASETGPDGNASMSTITVSATTSAHEMLQGARTVSANTIISGSFVVRAGTVRYVSVRLYSFNGIWSVAVFDLTTGTLTQESNGTTSGTILNSGIENLSNGLYRLSLTATNSFNKSYLIAQVHNTGTPTLNTYGGDTWLGAGETIELGLMQHEVGSTPSSYIPTTAGATVTRAAETLTVAAADMPWPTWGDPIGPELVTNGDFANGLTDYIDSSVGTGSVSVSGGVLTLLGDSNSDRGIVYQGITATAGDLVAITVDIAAVTSGSLGIGLDSNTVFGSVSWDTVGVSTVGSVTKIIRTPYSNPYVVLFTSDGSADIDVNNISVKEINPLSVSIQMDGRMTYADDDSSLSFAYWYKDSANSITQGMATVGARTGELSFNQEANNVLDFVRSSATAYAPDINVPFNIASRHGSTFLNGALEGTALTADLTPVALPDLSATDFKIGSTFMGNLGKARVWAVDLTDTGIAEASE